MAEQRDKQSAADQTVVIPAVQWPSTEPDAPPAANSGHGGYVEGAEARTQPMTGSPYAKSQHSRPQRDQAQREQAQREQAQREQAQREQAQREQAQFDQVQRDQARGVQIQDDTTQTQVIPAALPAGDQDEPPPASDDAGSAAGGPMARVRRLLSHRAAVIVAAVIGGLALLYGADLALAGGDVPRGVTVAGVEVGGLSRAAAEQRLHDEVGPRLSRPVTVRAEEAEATVEPAAAGLTLDWPATLEQAGDQPLNPFTRLWSLFGTREVGVVTRTDQAKLTTAVEALKPQIDRPSVEGSITFDGARPVPVDPVPGRQLEVPGAIDAIVADWATGRTIELPVTSTPVLSSPESVRAALQGVAEPAVSGPVKVVGEGAEATLTPEVIASALTFEVQQDGSLAPKYDNDKIIAALQPQLAKTEQPGKDAAVVLQGGAPVVQPSVDGRGIDWPKSIETLPDVLRTTENRSITAVYDHQPAKFTTEQANGLGIREVIGEFTTRGFATDSGVNIRAIAGEVNGALVKPGETFSLNKHTGPRGLEQGYIEAGIIDRGRPSRAIGGGCSQFATTLFNAAYFAGMTDVEHKEHSYYISRYPEAREATVFEGVIDLRFRNDAPTGAMIETIWTPTTITVRIWGTKHYQVESITSARSNFTEPTTVTVPHGEPCTAGNGAQGFTVSNTRIVRDVRTGAEVKRDSRTVVYNPLPKIICEPPPG